MNSGRSVRLYLEDILQAIAAIERYTGGLSQEEFAKNEMAQDASIRRLEVIGEAARQLPQDIRDRRPTVPWRQIAGMRNRIAHEYFGIALDRVWDVIQDELPKLKVEIIILRDTLQ